MDKKIRHKTIVIWAGIALTFIVLCFATIALILLEHPAYQNPPTIILLVGLAAVFVKFIFVLVNWIGRLESEVEELEFDNAVAIRREEKQIHDNVVSSVANYLFDYPETTLEQLKTQIEDASKAQIKDGARKTFVNFLDNKMFDTATSLLDHYHIDEHDQLRLAMKLNNIEQSGSVNLEPRIYKISIEENETAYEKLPCNWQKIHTYLTPLEDEFEQADILDTGNIYITDQRIFFVGKKGSETVYLYDIAYMDLKEDALQFFRDEGLSEIFAFPTPHHATYARLVIEELMNRQT